MKNNLIMLASSLLALSSTVISCSDFFDIDSEHIIYADQNHLHNATDTLYSVTGILNRLQAISDRTILLGEARGDLMDVTSKTPADLRNVAMFNIDDDNKYNSPSEYYAVINNCNYFIAHADTSLKNNRNEYLFKNEYAAVKAIRAWTYLQLVTTYGRVPFVLDPILTKEESERVYPMYDINEVCNYFLTQDGLQAMLDVEYPDYGDIKGLPSRMFFIPMYIILGDLNLWSGNYLDAAKNYYSYIINRNGSESAYPTGLDASLWSSANWTKNSGSSLWIPLLTESYSKNGEVITIIPGDSIPSEGYYSELRNVFNSTSMNDYEVSLVPSKGLIELSESQEYCHLDVSGNITDAEVIYAPHDLEKHQSGDLRLSAFWETYDNMFVVNGQTIPNYQYIYKYQTRNTRIYRRQVIYLRLAEALNRAGYPQFAFQILATGVDKDLITDRVLPEYPNEADSIAISYFEFPTAGNRFMVYNPYLAASFAPNMLGIHSRGCGYTMLNENYTMPYDAELAASDPEAHRQFQIRAVEDMIIDEEALELAFEGYRYYDLLRVAIRRETTEPDYLEKHIQNRRSGADTGIATDLKDKKNWFLHWNGQIGY